MILVTTNLLFSFGKFLASLGTIQYIYLLNMLAPLQDSSEVSDAGQNKCGCSPVRVHHLAHYFGSDYSGLVN